MLSICRIFELDVVHDKITTFNSIVLKCLQYCNVIGVSVAPLYSISQGRPNGQFWSLFTDISFMKVSRNITSWIIQHKQCHNYGIINYDVVVAMCCIWCTEL